AEADPTDDVEGHDAAAKLAILATVAFRRHVRGADVFREGISRITPRDFVYAKELGFAIKLLAIARVHDGEVEARVHPALVPLDHPLALVPDEFNAVMVEGADVGRIVSAGAAPGEPPLRRPWSATSWPWPEIWPRGCGDDRSPGMRRAPASGRLRTWWCPTSSACRSSTGRACLRGWPRRLERSRSASRP